MSMGLCSEALFAVLLQWTAEMNAAITQKFFAWLVGPLEVKEVDVQFDGKQQTWKSGVQITKCRYLEQSGCKGMCINMCKVSNAKTAAQIHICLSCDCFCVSCIGIDVPCIACIRCM